MPPLPDLPAEMGRPRILLIDDSHTARATLARALEAAGFEVLAAGDVAEALDVWAARNVDVVVADYHLPGMNGLDLLAALRSVDARRPLLLYSASMTPELATAARDFRVTAVLQVPVAVETLVAAVREVVAPGAPTPRAP